MPAPEPREPRHPRPAPLPPVPAARHPTLRPMVGLLLVGYGGLVLAGLLPHDAPVAGAASLLAGASLLAAGLPTATAPRGRIVALLGAACVGGVAGYNLARGSSWSPPEVAIAAYGVLLMVASRHLTHRLGSRLGGARGGGVRVATLVGWSFPLALAPLTLYALNAGLSSPATGAAATPAVDALVVTPTAAVLRLLGTQVEQVGSSLLLATPRGTLSLGVGLVCAGLYPMVLFGGLVAVHLWQDRVAPWRAAAVLAAGLAGLWALNVVRLVALTRIGAAYGMDALQAAHAHLGWLLFAAFMAVFWRFAVRDGGKPAAAAEAIA